MCWIYAIFESFWCINWASKLWSSGLRDSQSGVCEVAGRSLLWEAPGVCEGRGRWVVRVGVPGENFRDWPGRLRGELLSYCRLESRQKARAPIWTAISAWMMGMVEWFRDIPGVFFCSFVGELAWCKSVQEGLCRCHGTPEFPNMDCGYSEMVEPTRSKNVRFNLRKPRDVPWFCSWLWNWVYHSKINSNGLTVSFFLQNSPVIFLVLPFQPPIRGRQHFQMLLRLQSQHRGAGCACVRAGDGVMFFWVGPPIFWIFRFFPLNTFLSRIMFFKSRINTWMCGTLPFQSDKHSHKIPIKSHEFTIFTTASHHVTWPQSCSHPTGWGYPNGWMVYVMDNSKKKDALGDTTISGNIHIMIFI